MLQPGRLTPGIFGPKQWVRLSLISGSARTLPMYDLVNINPKKDKVWPEVVKREERAKVHGQIEIISQGQTVCEYISTLKSIKSCD